MLFKVIELVVRSEKSVPIQLQESHRETFVAKLHCNYHITDTNKPEHDKTNKITSARSEPSLSARRNLESLTTQ